MFVSLTRTKRLRAGWLVALAYLFCVLAPTISFALPGGHATPYCLTDDDHVPGVVHVHNEGIVPHVHKDGDVHDHSGVQGQAHVAGELHAKSIALNDGSAPAKAPHSLDGKCCGLKCVTALPAMLINIAKPSVPRSVREAESYRTLTNNTPPQRYRPPIS